MDLTNLYTSRGLLQDQNGDGWIDSVGARIVLRRDATIDEQVAAVNVAARLGFETMSLALPIAVVEDDTAEWSSGVYPIYIGAPSKISPTRGPQPMLVPQSSSAGHGSVRLVPPTGQTPRGIAVNGDDGAGLAAAASLLYSRLPYAWHIGDGHLTLADIAADLLRALDPEGTWVQSLSIAGAHVTASRPGIDQLDVDIQCPDAATGERVVSLLEDMGRPVLVGQGPGPRGLVVWVRGGGMERRVARTLAPRDARLPTASVQRQPSPRSFVSHEPVALSTLYDMHNGLFVDMRGNLLPDRLRARIVLPASCMAVEAVAACDVAARLGLETLGLQLPIAMMDQLAGPTDEGDVHILIGDAARHKQPGVADILRGVPASSGVLVAGEDNAGQLIVAATGADAQGTSAALRYLAARAPYVAMLERGDPVLADMEMELHTILDGRSLAGEVVAAVTSFDEIAVLLAGQPMTSLRIAAFVANPTPGADAYMAARLQALVPGIDVAVETLDRTALVPIVADHWQAPWEVDYAQAVLAHDLLPLLRERMTPPTTLEVDLRVSEPLAVRRSLQMSISDLLVEAGVPREHCTIIVRPTYKQGSSWLLEVVLPQLQSLGSIGRLTIACKRFAPTAGAGWVDLPTRWVQELFPVDELLAGELGIDVANVQYDVRDDLDATYEVIAEATHGQIIWRDTFTACTDERPYLPGYPHWGLVHPDTGWLHVRVDDTVVIDRRMPTDRDMFWDYYQGTILPRIGERILALSADAGSAQGGPYFERLDIDLAISEEDRAVGLREERYSPLESLHEDLYFVTLDYCSAVTLTAHAQSSGQSPYEPPWMAQNDDSQALPRSSPHSAPGLIVPRIHQSLEAGVTVHVRMDELRAPQPLVQWRAEMSDGSTTEGAVEIPPLSCPHPRTTRIVVAPAGARISQADVAVACTDTRQMHACAQRLEALTVLHKHRLYLDTPLRPAVELVNVTVSAGEEDRTYSLGPATAPTPVPPRSLNPAPPTPDAITWDSLIGYEENIALLQGLALYPEVRVWQAGSSVQGRRSYAVEVTAPLPGPLRSQAKESTFKPTLLINTRHHANETSGTSALLRLIALCATDPTMRSYLQRTNLVVVPFENVDGAVLHEELQRDHPAWMLHAGRYNARGMEFRLDYMNDETPYPEARVLPRVYRLWLPDIVTDDHGFPSHEWVQPFGGYANPWFASDWIPRGLIYLYLPFAHGPQFEGHERLALALRDVVVDDLNQDTEIRSWNLTWADRFEKYVHQWLPERFPATYVNGVLVHTEPITPDPTRPWASWMTGFTDAYPHITAISWITEVADETARGAYHHLCARAHLLVDVATLRLLATSVPSVERVGEEATTSVFLSMYRQRPPVIATTTADQFEDRLAHEATL